MWTTPHTKQGSCSNYAKGCTKQYCGFWLRPSTPASCVWIKTLIYSSVFVCQNLCLRIFLCEKKRLNARVHTQKHAESVFVSFQINFPFSPPCKQILNTYKSPISSNNAKFYTSTDVVLQSCGFMTCSCVYNVNNVHGFPPQVLQNTRGFLSLMKSGATGASCYYICVLKKPTWKWTCGSSS